MLRIGLMSDTHGFLDDAVFRYFAECDEIWHAGDFGPVHLLDRLQAFKPLRGVFGNIDGAEVRSIVPRDLEWECEGLRVYMTHINDRRAKAELTSCKAGLFVCGHSHILKVTREDSFVHLNPGACGHQGWHTMRTLLRFSVEAGKLQAMQAIELGPRGRSRSGPGS